MVCAAMAVVFKVLRISLVGTNLVHVGATWYDMVWYGMVPL